MRTISLFAMCVLLAACTTAPMFPPEIMKGVEKDNFDFKAWKEQAYQPSSTHFVPHKVELGGRIIKVIRKPEGVIILAEKQPIEKYPGDGSNTAEQESPFMYAIFFNGFPESGMLQVGNRLAVVGATGRAGTEVIGWTPTTMPHLLAQCLHIWNSRGLKTVDDFSSEGAMGYYSPEERTFCIKESEKRPLSASGAPTGP
jgi:starvation-inducible outer membrane lipoprotein